mmetsp:Transcript_7794/g.15721  ORF Transcript_7794/g.15721 Transcript_7794/m.15721 type:complete len:155 (-) Transcript_7794:134-598(-)
MPLILYLKTLQRSSSVTLPSRLRTTGYDWGIDTKLWGTIGNNALAEDEVQVLHKLNTIRPCVDLSDSDSKLRLARSNHRQVKRFSPDDSCLDGPRLTQDIFQIVRTKIDRNPGSHSGNGVRSRFRCLVVNQEPIARISDNPVITMAEMSERMHH